MMATQTPPNPIQTVEASALRNRFISTEIDRFTLVFPAVWVAEIFRIDRAQILNLPFYEPLMMGIIHHHGSLVPLIAAAGLLKVERFGVRERSIAVRLNESAGSLANIGIVVDRAIGTITRQDLPPELFTTSATDGLMLMMSPDLIPSGLWQPQN